MRHGAIRLLAALLGLLVAARAPAFEQAAAPSSAGAGPAAARPNVVLIVSDDQGWADYSAMGHPHIRTPRIDRLASESLWFTRGYSVASLCRPSLASLLTGRFPHEHRVVGNDPRLPEELTRLSPAGRRTDPRYALLREQYAGNLIGLPLLPRMLTDAGYLAHQSGKWWEGHFARGGFTHGMTHGDPARTGRHGDEGLEIGRKTMQPIWEFVDLARGQQRPFFLFYAPMLPHTPHDPPERLLAHYRSCTPHEPLARYWAMCEWFDETVGELLEGLESRGLAANTIVVYVTDNGWIQSEDGRALPDEANRGKRSPYDGGVRTPVLVRWPGRLAPRREDVHPVSSLDIMPTILEAVGLPRPPAVAGTSLLDAEGIARRKAVFGEIFEHDAQSLTDPAASLRFRWVVAGEWKLIAPCATREPRRNVELHHVTMDPEERVNLAETEPERVAEMMQWLDAWWAPECPRPTHLPASPAVPSEQPPAPPPPGPAAKSPPAGR